MRAACKAALAQAREKSVKGCEKDPIHWEATCAAQLLFHHQQGCLASSLNVTERPSSGCGRTKRQLGPMALPALTASAVRRLVTRTDNGEKFVMQCIGPSKLFVPKTFVLKAAYQLWYHLRCQATCSTRKQPHPGALPASSQRWRALDECHAGDAAQPFGQGPSDRKWLCDTPQRHPGSGYA